MGLGRVFRQCIGIDEIDIATRTLESHRRPLTSIWTVLPRGEFLARLAAWPRDPGRLGGFVKIRNPSLGGRWGLHASPGMSVDVLVVEVALAFFTLVKGRRPGARLMVLS